MAWRMFLRLGPAGSALALPRRRRGAVVRLLDRVHELVLVHPRPATHVEPFRDVHEVALGGVGVHPTGGVPVAATGARGSTALRSLGVARALGSLLLPVVTDLLEGVLERREGSSVGALPLAVLLDRRVVRGEPRLLGLLRGPLEGRGQVDVGRPGGALLGGHCILLGALALAGRGALVVLTGDVPTRDMLRLHEDGTAYAIGVGDQARRGGAAHGDTSSPPRHRSGHPTPERVRRRPAAGRRRRSRRPLSGRPEAAQLPGPPPTWGRARRRRTAGTRRRAGRRRGRAARLTRGVAHASSADRSGAVPIAGYALARVIDGVRVPAVRTWLCTP